MNERVNRFNNISILGKERAEREIVSLIGNEVLTRVFPRHKAEEEKKELFHQFMECPLELAEWKSTADIIEGALRIILKMYADKDYNDKKMAQDCLELRHKQFAERAKK